MTNLIYISYRIVTHYINHQFVHIFKVLLFFKFQLLKKLINRESRVVSGRCLIFLLQHSIYF